MDIGSIIKEAICRLIADQRDPEIDKCVSVDDFNRMISKYRMDLERVCAEMTILALHTSKNRGDRSKRDSLTYITSTSEEDTLRYLDTPSTKWAFDLNVVKECLVSANRFIELIHDISILYTTNLFQILGLRNLSAFVGEIYAKELAKSTPDRLMPNPNQDGYPDLCALTVEGKEYINRHKRENGTIKSDKNLWSPYPMGGIEIKATCGNTPPASAIPKPLIGESRLPTMTSAEWKAHHQETKSLLGVFWDFVDGLPTILAIFFRNDLDTTIGSNNKDWGGIIRPIDGAGRTTSVSIMKQGRTSNEGVKKMGQGWLVLPNDEQLLKAICAAFSIDLRKSLL